MDNPASLIPENLWLTIIDDMNTTQSIFNRSILIHTIVFWGLILSFPFAWAQQGASFTPESISAYPFPSSLTSAASGSRIAWIFNEQGLRNIYVTEGPDFKARKLTNYDQDDGQEISSMSISPDGKWVVYLRGGEHGSNWDDEETINPLSMPHPPKVEMWSVAFGGGEPQSLGEGAGPVISPNSMSVTFVKNGQIWSAPIDGSAEAIKMTQLRGRNGSPVWSPDGSKLAFVSSRGDRAFIGIYIGQDNPVQWVAPDFDRDYSPRWSPDGEKLVFIRRPGGGGEPDPIVEAQHNPWKIMTYDIASRTLKLLWEAPKTLRGSIPRTHGGTNLHWADDKIVFLSYHDGWPHLYAMAESDNEPQLLTPGDFMAEHITMSANGKWLVFAGNAGPDRLDVDRRHILRVTVGSGEMELMTPGTGLEWFPVITGDGNTIACISATPQRPPLPAVMPMSDGKLKLLGEDRIPNDFPTSQLVTPRQVIFNAPDGTTIHGTLFERTDIVGQKPAVVYVHGGPPRQMLLGWHYSSYYSNAYAVNQFLASQGFAVLSVNYRLGIGYGYEFHYPPRTGWRGAEEYQDVMAAGDWLAKQPQIDPNRIGIYGGSYGGFLTAMALGKDSRLFAAGVDIHGVHDRTVGRSRNIILPDGYEKAPDAEYALQTAWKSSPVAWVDGWTSPVLIIHGDDDRNVRFDQSTDLVQRLRKRNVPMETLVIVDDSHHFMRHANQLTVNRATVGFLIKHLR